MLKFHSANCAFDHDVMVSSLARISSEACSRSNRQGQSSKRSRLAEVEVQLVETSDFETHNDEDVPPGEEGFCELVPMRRSC